MRASAPSGSLRAAPSRSRCPLRAARCPMFCLFVATFGIESARLLREYYTVCATRSCSCSGMCRPGGTASSRATVNSGSAGMHRPQAYCSALLSGAPPHAAPDAACAHRRVPRAPRSAQCAHCARPRRLVHGAHRGTGPFAIPPRLSGAREPLGAAAGAGGRRQPQRMGRARPAARAAHPTSLGAVPPPPPSRSPDASHRIALPFFTLQAPALFCHGALRRAGWRTRGTARRRGPSRLRRACTAWASSSRKCIDDSTRTHSSAAVVNRLAHSLPQTHACTPCARPKSLGNLC